MTALQMQQMSHLRSKVSSPKLGRHDHKFALTLLVAIPAHEEYPEKKSWNTE